LKAAAHSGFFSSRRACIGYFVKISKVKMNEQKTNKRMVGLTDGQRYE